MGSWVRMREMTWERGPTATPAQWAQSGARFRSMAEARRGSFASGRRGRHLPPVAYSVTLRRIARLCERMAGAR